MKDASDGRETTKLQSPRVPSFEMWVAFVLVTPITFFFLLLFPQMCCSSAVIKKQKTYKTYGYPCPLGTCSLWRH